MFTNDCIAAVGSFFYDSRDFRFTKPFFQCCEHEDWCFGVPRDQYSPWNCLQTDPFYSCNDVLRQCITDEECEASYNNVTMHCPAEMFSVTMPCPNQVPELCADNLKNLEGWYCSCRPTLASDKQYLYLCNARKEIFTHNKCLEESEVVKMRISMSPMGIFTTPLIWACSTVSIFVISLCTFKLMYKRKLRRNHQELIRRFDHQSQAAQKSSSIVDTGNLHGVAARSSHKPSMSSNSDREQDLFVNSHTITTSPNSTGTSTRHE